MQLRRIVSTTIVLLLVSLAFTGKAVAYPDFISYGYTTCITCHYNGAGGGALNDYGKALFAQEIAARDFIPKNVSDEELGERSGFLGKTAMPSWFNPNIKYRGLYYQTDPGSTKATRKWIDMQRDINIASFTESGKLGAVVNYGLLPQDTDVYGTGSKISALSREYYIRYQVTKNLYAYAGLMDKVFGIRHGDHTAFNRIRTDITMNAQTHGALLQYLESNYDVSLNMFLGNQSQQDTDRYKGTAIMAEYLWRENHKPGMSVMQESRDNNLKTAIAVHDRLAVSPHTSLLAEVGYVEDKGSLVTQKGPYFFLQNMIAIRRGYNFLTTIERSSVDDSTNTTDQWRWSLGFLTFPYPRFEVRLQAIDYRTFRSDSGIPDSWQLLEQIHFSW